MEAEQPKIQEVHTAEEYKDLLGQRIGIKKQNAKEHKLYEDVGLKSFQHVGSIRYVGKILNNPKAGDSIWIGVEWDFDAAQGGPGKHQGTVDGVKYFEPEFHNQSDSFLAGESQCCSFVRHGKVTIGGVSIVEALNDQYKPQDTEESKFGDADLVVSTNKKGGQKKIEVLGVDQSYNWRSDIGSSREITLQYLKISSLGPPGSLRDLIPKTMSLFLDKNFLHSWDQFFQITSELRWLRTLALSGNKFKKIDATYLEGKNVDQMVNTQLSELILIDMSLEWGQIDILAPTLIYVEQLYLVRNNCKKICSQFKISKDYFKNLRYLNLEQNGIESWDELVGFRALQELSYLIVNKNKLREIYHKPGFRGLKRISFEDNLISDWKTFDQLNEFDSRIGEIRSAGNPVLEEKDLQNKRARQVACARMEFLTKFNGTKIEAYERKDFELFYLKIAYESYLRDVLKCKDEKDIKVTSLDDEGLQAYALEFHPRFYQLAQVYGSPLDMVNLKSEGKNIAQLSAKMDLIYEATGKTLTKKLLFSMTITALKAMVAKIFKVNPLEQSLYYHGPEDTMDYPLDEEYRQLSFYSMAEGGKIIIRSKS